MHNLRLDGLLTLIAMIYGLLHEMINLNPYHEQLHELVELFDMQKATASLTEIRKMIHMIMKYLLQQNFSGTGVFLTFLNYYSFLTDQQRVPKILCSTILLTV